MNVQNTTAAAAISKLENAQDIINVALKLNAVRKDIFLQAGLITLRELIVQQTNTIVDLTFDSSDLAQGLIDANKRVERLEAALEEAQKKNEQAAQ